MGFADLRWSILSGYGPLFLQGLQMTLWLTAVSLIGGLALGIVLGLISSTTDSPPPRTRGAVLGWQLLRGATRAYVGFFRGTPLFVQILLVHFALMPMLVQPEGGLLLSGEAARAFRQHHGAFFSGALALTLNAGAYISEILRAGIHSIHGGQTQAAYSVGLTHGQAMRYIVLPQGIRAMTPLLLNQVIIVFQDTSLVYVVALRDFMTTASVVASRDGRPTEMYTLVAVIYLAICFSLAKAVERLARRRAT